MVDARVKEFLADRLASVQKRIAGACSRAGRNPADVTLVAVTKTVSVPIAAALHELGIIDLGESRPQELWHKASALPDTVRWHLVGHLQRNKIERTLPFVSSIQSVDSLRLLDALDGEANRTGRSVSILLEVNASREASKSGFSVEELTELVPQLCSLNYVSIRGLMTMAAFEADPETCRPTFCMLRELRDSLCSQFGSPHRLDQLSMGMTNDYEIAIEEGATMVRIGTALFDGLSEVEDARR
jgi:pyridoxal phosphate enzyme (YggS family)